MFNLDVSNSNFSNKVAITLFNSYSVKKHKDNEKSCRNSEWNIREHIVIGSCEISRNKLWGGKTHTESISQKDIRTSLKE